MSKRYYILLVFIFLTKALLAQTPKLTASVSKAQVGTGDTFEITFSISANVEGFNPPDMSAFQIVGGPNQSSSMEMINGATTVNTAYSFVLMAVKEGEFTIGPGAVVVNGRRISSNAVKVKVVKGQRAQQSTGGRAKGMQPAAGNLPLATDLSKDLFLRAVIDKDNVYQGQQILLTYRIYTRVAITQYNVTKLPDLTGFWNEDITPPKQAQLRQEVLNGVKYNVADLKQVILFPEHAGNITIDPFSTDFVVRLPAPAKDIMDQFFGGAFVDKKYTTKSAPLVVHVRPLPENGKPPGFTGAVGNFSIESSIDKTSVKANDPLNYKVKVTGAGNIKLLKELNPNFPSDFEKYDPKLTDSITDKAAGVSGYRFYNYLLIPRKEGDYTIDPLKLSYFNPSTGRYTTLTTKGFHIKVAKGNNESNVTALAGDKQDVKLLAKDIRYIKTGSAGLTKAGEDFFGSLLYYLLLLLGPALCLIAYLVRNWHEKANSDIVKVKSRRASRVAAKHLANAQKQLTAKNTQAFYEAVFRGLYGYLGDKLNISYADLNKDVITSTLSKRGVESGVIDHLMETLDMCEMARYAPVTVSEQQVFEKAKGVINDIEDEI